MLVFTVQARILRWAEMLPFDDARVVFRAGERVRPVSHEEKVHGNQHTKESVYIVPGIVAISEEKAPIHRGIQVKYQRMEGVLGVLVDEAHQIEAAMRLVAAAPGGLAFCMYDAFFAAFAHQF